MIKALAAVLTLAALLLSLPPGRALIEQSMVWHMLVQMPLLVLAGFCASMAWPRVLGSGLRNGLGSGLSRFNRYGLTGFMLAQCITAYWMIPAMVDRAVVLPSADAFKLLGLWLSGVALRQSFLQAPLAVQLFFVGYGLPMMAWLGFYMANTNLRLCNAYSLESQLRAGQGLVLLAIALGLVWAASVREQLLPAARSTLGQQ